MQILRYLGIFILLVFVASLAFCSMGIYQGFSTANRVFAGADNYTCRQFTYDLEQPDTDKFAPMLIATVAYGSSPVSGTESRSDEVVEKGMEPALRKVYALCKGKPAERVLNLFAADITGLTPAPSAGSAVSPTNPQQQ